MDGIFLSSSAEKSVSPNKQLKNIPRRHSSGAHTSIIHGGGGGGGLFLAPPPSLSFSYPFYQAQHQPPLLPLPLPNKPLYTSLPSRTPTLSSSPSNLKSNRYKDQSLTPPKRSKSKQLSGKSVGEPKKLQTRPTEGKKAQGAISKPFVMASGGPQAAARDLERLSSSIFTLSPPPSSLPLPSFSLRPKLGCKAEAGGGVDDGATDNLRRLLRLP
ncbi:hypothetical protein Gogos_011696 [Gossypium gossypioides]|uniref:Uncharacterized protein n=1 Tax=Gossypium gossypioides TaxID=34282 RepID=A0A7J9BQ58_GOSGO|nr:hypothetical protein [Gossypium gossypioides]